MFIEDFKYYRKSASQPMTPWKKGMEMNMVSISGSDLREGSPKEGDMIAQNPKDTSDMWLVAKRFFDDNYEEIPSMTKDNE